MTPAVGERNTDTAASAPEHAPQQHTGRRPGMMDVARQAGVSHQTVSRVINQPDTVRPATRAKVEAAIAKLGYRPNLAARALVTDSTRTLGVVTTNPSFHGPVAATSAIETAARQAGYACLVASLPDADEESLEDVLRFFVARGVDGVIAVVPQMWAEASLSRMSASVPVVVVADGLKASARMHVVSVDQELGARLAVSHLIERGCRTIAHLAGPLDWYDAAARVRGWRSTLSDAGLDIPELLVGDWTAPSGYQIGCQMLQGELPDAVFCSNDLMALGLLAALSEHGVGVPERIRVAGFDDIEGAAYFSPSLTTVHQPMVELGRTCLDVILAAMREETGRNHSIAPQLRARLSA